MYQVCSQRYGSIAGRAPLLLCSGSAPRRREAATGSSHLPIRRRLPRGYPSHRRCDIDVRSNTDDKVAQPFSLPQWIACGSGCGIGMGRGTRGRFTRSWCRWRCRFTFFGRFSLLLWVVLFLGPGERRVVERWAAGQEGDRAKALAATYAWTRKLSLRLVTINAVLAGVLSAVVGAIVGVTTAVAGSIISGIDPARAPAHVNRDSAPPAAVGQAGPHGPAPRSGNRADRGRG